MALPSHNNLLSGAGSNVENTRVCLAGIELVCICPSWGSRDGNTTICGHGRIASSLMQSSVLIFHSEPMYVPMYLHVLSTNSDRDNAIEVCCIALFSGGSDGYLD